MTILRIVLGVLLFFGTLFGIGYILVWWGIVEPIMTILTAIDNDAVTATLIGWQVIYFLIRGVLATLVAIVGFTLTSLCFIGLTD